MAIIIKSAIRKGEALVLQVLSTGVYADFTSSATPFVITFPDLSVLTINSTFFLDPNYLTIANIGTKISAYYNTNLLTDMQKWGFDTDPADKFLHISLADLRAQPAKYTYKDSLGVVIPFSYTVLPDGVYKIVTTGTITVGGEVVNYTARTLSTAVSDKYLSISVNSYLLLKVDETAYKQDVDNLKDMVEKVMIIQYAIRYDFNNGYYTDSNTKANALKSIIDTGIYVFKPGH